MANPVKLEISEVLKGIEIPNNITSIERFLQIVNDPSFRGLNNICRMYLYCSQSFQADLSLTHFRDGRLVSGGSSEDQLIEKPIVVGYKDGGFEYLSGFTGPVREHSSYVCELFIPSTNSLFSYCRPVHNLELLTKLKES